MTDFEKVTRDDLIDMVTELIVRIRTINEGCNRHALPGEFTIVGQCGYCGKQQYAGHGDYVAHRKGCAIGEAFQFCQRILPAERARVTLGPAAQAAFDGARKEDEDGTD